MLLAFGPDDGAGKAVGVINSYRSVLHMFTGEEVKMLQTIANQAAIACHRAYDPDREVP